MACGSGCCGPPKQCCPERAAPSSAPEPAECRITACCGESDGQAEDENGTCEDSCCRDRPGSSCGDVSPCGQGAKDDSGPPGATGPACGSGCCSALRSGQTAQEELCCTGEASAAGKDSSRCRPQPGAGSKNTGCATDSSHACPGTALFEEKQRGGSAVDNGIIACGKACCCSSAPSSSSPRGNGVEKALVAGCSVPANQGFKSQGSSPVLSTGRCDVAAPECCKGKPSPCCDNSCIDRLALRACQDETEMDLPGKCLSSCRFFFFFLFSCDHTPKLLAHMS